MFTRFDEIIFNSTDYETMIPLTSFAKKRELTFDGNSFLWANKKSGLQQTSCCQLLKRETRSLRLTTETLFGVVQASSMESEPVVFIQFSVSVIITGRHMDNGTQ